MRSAFVEIARELERAHPEIQVDVIFGASGTFHAQIRSGAPFDVFFSADTKYPAALARDGLTAGDPFDYATGQLVLWSRRGSPLDVTDGLEGLLSPEVKKIAIANPILAPYGAAAVEVLEHRGLQSRLQTKLVYGENVVQTAQFAESGAADAAIIALSVALSPRMQQEGSYWTVPAEWHSPIRQAAVILNGSNADARLFCDFVLSSRGRAILRKFGYAVPGGR